MFSKIKSAIDRSIAEEQARQKALAEQRSHANPSPPAGSQRARSVSTTRRKARKPGQDVSNGDMAANPDPAIFEAAFVLDDEDADSAATAQVAPHETEMKEGVVDSEMSNSATENSNATGQTGTQADEKLRDVPSAAPAELPPHIRARLRKLEKLESTYPELLRSYRIAHGRATLIEPFERALRENTPLTTIKDPIALVEYLNQLNLKGDMVMGELKRVSAEKDSFKKKSEDANKELSALKEKMASLEASQAEASLAENEDKEESVLGETKGEESKQATLPSASKSPVSSIFGVFSPKQKPVPDEETKDRSEEMFSYDDEIPQLQAEIASKSEEIVKLKSEVSLLKEELAVAGENSGGLVESLEKATRELGEIRDKVAIQDLIQTQLDARNSQIKLLTEKFEQTQSQLRDLEANLEDEKLKTASATRERESKLEASNSKNTQLDAELKKLIEVKSQLETKIRELESEIKSLKMSKSESEKKVEQLSTQIQSAGQPASASTAGALEIPVATPGAGGPRKKNNKKKKKGGASSGAMSVTASEASESAQPSPLDSPDMEALKAEVARLNDEIADRDTRIERLSKQKKTEEDLREEIETIQEDLVNIGQDHVEAKEKVKSLESEKAALLARIAELEKQIAAFTSSTEATSTLRTDFDSMKAEFDDLKIKSHTLQSDLGAAHQLAQSRYKDLTDLREILTKVQPELKSLRQDSSVLKTTKEELASKQTELRALEKREKELKVEVSKAQRLASDRESEIRLLNDRLAAEKASRARLEDEKRVAGRDYRRAEVEKIELSARVEKTGRELESVQSELFTLRPKIKQLEDEVAKLKKENESIREEAELKAQQYNSAQGLLSSMRDQTAELSVRLKEAQDRAESLEEELAEVQKHLSERTREGEKMRRMLADVDERADAKVREMRARMEAAVEERDRIEDESSTLGRRRVRESEELKSKVRELEREVRTLSSQKDDLEAREKEWRRRREELEQIEEKAAAEVDDMRVTVTNLRSALDASEQQVRDTEKQRADLRKLLDETRGRYEKENKELKSIQARFSIGSSPNVASSGRSSIDSTRSGLNGAASTSGSTSPDTMYLKTILLQFLEVKDEKVRSQLVPVLGKLLRFDRNDEQKWIAAVQHLSRPGR
ncbi:GRIP domain-containing protein [Durotheca rogersii]|uniref:GRIP domain-containing protein n=1 Tax=Durotheca rogersii TaxID=419775 RepID=UPI00221EB2BA|nr:GRIP domain-containing protein [Durotheca rogersii]KAI5860937.1 GRIP domain-containing protein [Durotheca rogersii]